MSALSIACSGADELPMTRISATRFFLVALLAVVFPAIAGSAATPAFEIVKMRFLAPAQVAETIRATFGRSVRVAEIPHLNGVCLSTDDPALLKAASRLVADLDQPQATLRYTLRKTGHETRSHRRLGFGGGRIGGNSVANRSGEGELRSVTGMNGQEVGLLDEQRELRDFATPWGPQTQEIRHVGGLRARGRLVGEAEAIVELGYGDGDHSRGTRIFTELRVRLGEWVPIGGASDERSDHRRSLAADRNESVSATISRDEADSDADYFLKVERVP